MKSSLQSVTLAMTGASGAQYGLRLLECLLEAGVHVYVLISQPAKVVLHMETDLHLPGRPREIERVLRGRFQDKAGQLEVLGEKQWTAPIASGSAVADAMVICPCTTGTLSAIATGASRSLIERAADVTLKEKRKLLVVLRETPLSEIHLENMLRLSRMNAVVLPASPGFYHRPQRVEDLVDFIVTRVLDHLGVPNNLLPRWGDKRGGSTE